MKTIRNILRWLLGGSFTLIIAACYGIPADYQGKNVRIKCKNTNDQPIPGLELKVLENGLDSSWNTTDAEGTADFFIPEFVSASLMIRAADIDGLSNLGDFQTMILSNLTYGTIETNYTFILTNK